MRGSEDQPVEFSKQTDDMISVGLESTKLESRSRWEQSDRHPITAHYVLVRQATRHLRKKLEGECGIRHASFRTPCVYNSAASWIRGNGSLDSCATVTEIVAIIA